LNLLQQHHRGHALLELHLLIISSLLAVVVEEAIMEAVVEQVAF
jgi:hypothetical protein